MGHFGSIFGHFGLFGILAFYFFTNFKFPPTLNIQKGMTFSTSTSLLVQVQNLPSSVLRRARASGIHPPCPPPGGHLLCPPGWKFEKFPQNPPKSPKIPKKSKIGRKSTQNAEKIFFSSKSICFFEL